MSSQEGLPGLDKDTDDNYETWAVGMHGFSYIAHTSPVVFLYLLRECYFHGLCISTCKSTTRFRSIQRQIHKALSYAPKPGPATFIACCLYALPVLQIFSEGISHLLLASIRSYLRVGTTTEDSIKAKDYAARSCIDMVGGMVNRDVKVVMMLVETFDVKLVDIERVICKYETKSNNFRTAKTLIEQYIFRLIELESYNASVMLLEQFSIRQSGEDFIHKMVTKKQFKAAEQWATFMGKSMLCALIQVYLKMKLIKKAYEIIKKNNLQQEYPDVCHKCKERDWTIIPIVCTDNGHNLAAFSNNSSLKKLAEKGCWDLAETRTRGDRELVEYLVYLAMEAGYWEKVDELCNQYSLQGFTKAKEHEINLPHAKYLDINNLLVEDVIWVDEVNGLRDATDHIEGCKLVGIDCEWKPLPEKGGKPKRVSIMQIASEKIVYIFDMIKLYENVPDSLDNCLARIFHSPRILKLGYNIHGDIKHLARYKELECFKHYEMLLDIQNVFREPNGGLSGLSKKVLGAGLNKTRRNSNWEHRPLSQNQLEYAALDAVVLIHIFCRIRNHFQRTDELANFEWKSHIVSHMKNSKKAKKELQRTNVNEAVPDKR